MLSLKCEFRIPPAGMDGRKVMERSAESLVLEGGKSGELVAAFSLVAEAEVDGEPRFFEKAVRDMETAIVCRTYARPLLELCHLLRIADAAPDGYLGFFWGGGVARASAFKGWATRHQQTLSAASPPVHREAGDLIIGYDDAPFGVSFGRMGFLSAMMEFLVSSLGFDVIDDFVGELRGKGTTAGAVSAQANVLSRKVYDYLKDHLPTAQVQRKFHALTGHLGNRLGASFSVRDVNDQHIFDFWAAQAAGEDDGREDFKTFESVFWAFVRLHEVLEIGLAKAQAAMADTIGHDREAGEVNPELSDVLMDAIHEQASPLAQLDEEPASLVKFLNKKEKELARTIVESGLAGRQWVLSVLRVEVFGKGQARIVQALRRKLTGPELAAVIAECAENGYGERQAEWRKLLDHISGACKACLYALHRAGSVPDVEDSEVLERAFKGLSRKGFEDRPEDDPDRLAAFAEGGSILLDVERRLTAFLDAMGAREKTGGGWREQFDGDRTRFHEQFSLIYGGH